LRVRASPEVNETRRAIFRLIARIEIDPTLPAALRTSVSKWRGTLARVSLLFHLILLAEKGKAEPHEKSTLAPEAVEMAAAFIRKGVAPSTFSFYRELAAR
jgi:hypothetical protein